MLPARKIVLAAACAAACACLSACGGGGDNENTLDGQNPPPPPTRYFSIGGAVDSAFTGKLVLEDQYPVNGATRTDRVTLSSSGAFQVSSQVPQGDSYQVSVATQPPDQYCTVAQGSGTAQAAVSNVAVSCGPGQLQVIATIPASGASGYQAESAPMLASDGNFYVEMYYGGTANDGTITRITPAGVVTPLYSFTALGTDGARPGWGLVQGANGELYGTDSFGGGTSDIGSVFAIDLQGSETILHDFSTTGADAKYTESTLTLAGNGNYYGVTQQGGAYNGGAIYSIAPGGAYSVVYSFPAYTAGGPLSAPYGNLVVGSNGDLYGIATAAGSNNTGGVFEFHPATATLTDFSSSPAGSPIAYGQLMLASDGNFYGIADVSPNEEIFRVTPAGAFSYLYTFGSQSGDVSGEPYQLVQASDGDLYGVGNGGGANGAGGIFRFDPTSSKESVVYSFASASGSLAYGPSSALYLGANGLLYGTTASPGDGVLYALN